MTKFQFIYADPPWRFNNRGNRFAPDYADAYVTSPLDPILNMGPAVQEISTDDALLGLWCPAALILEGVGAQVCLAWGFTPKQIIPWFKVCKDGKTPRIGGGNYTRACSELMILASRIPQTLKKNQGVAGVILEHVDDVIVAERGKHSAKPDEAYELIEKISNGPYLELFARRRFSEKWTVLGDQAPGVGCGDILGK